MCGIFMILNNDTISKKSMISEFEKGKNRGPESSILNTNDPNCIFGFHRLAINGLNEISNQPFYLNNVMLICNGEIYNYKQLYHDLQIPATTDSDCEIIIHLYKKVGIQQTLLMLDGVFSFILYDYLDLTNPKIYIARDPLGVRPLFQITHLNTFGFSSDLKCLSNFWNTKNTTLRQFTPGTYSTFQSINKKWTFSETKPYYIPTFSYNWLSSINDIHDIHQHLIYYLTVAVNKRCITTDRPIACLLSGGLDSSLITALVNNFYKLNNIQYKLETYSIGLKGSDDLKNAKIVAEYLDTHHTEIIVTEDEMFNAIPEVIYNIESFDTTTVRASIGNYLLGKYIKTHSKAKVIFNGDGSDELFGGYLYMNKCPDDIEFDKETRRLLQDIHLFDVLRSDKSISSNGLEPRTPFLDKNLVNYVLSIPSSYRNHNNHKKMEKNILRQSFYLFKNFEEKQILPDCILFRKKEAFSDGVSGTSGSFYQILQSKIANFLNTSEIFSSIQVHYMNSIETEKFYYEMLFTSYYKNCKHLIPYFWMPKYTTSTDPSARTLSFY